MTRSQTRQLAGTKQIQSIEQTAENRSPLLPVDVVAMHNNLLHLLLHTTESHSWFKWRCETSDESLVAPVVLHHETCSLLVYLWKLTASISDNKSPPSSRVASDAAVLPISNGDEATNPKPSFIFRGGTCTCLSLPNPLHSTFLASKTAAVWFYCYD